MKLITRKQKHALLAGFYFWLAHASHWFILCVMASITLAFLYLFWANDALFAATMWGL